MDLNYLYPALQTRSDALHCRLMARHVLLLRPKDWIKNLFVFAALIFSGKVMESSALLLALAAFAAFCCAASAGYILNDIMDRQRDRLHPVKRHRPIASGAIPIPVALGIMTILLAGAVAICAAVRLPWAFDATLAGYFVLTTAYSLALKHRMLLDVLMIAVLFVLRALAGAYAIEVNVSYWLLVCTFMLCLFLGFGKRRCEIAMIDDEEAMRGHRPLLIRYTPDLLNNLLSTTGGIAIITFLLYTHDRSVPSTFDDRKEYLAFTLPFVVYGIFRYTMLIGLGKATGPTDLVVGDPPLLITIVLWAVTAVAILYGGLPWNS